jgi:ATP-dependent RNA helicase DHR2
VDAALRTIFQIHYKEPLPGDILVFLTGQETVESLERLVNEYALGLGPEVLRLLVLPLFAALPQAQQQKVFQPPPFRTRKVILATNIAETSVTVAGVRHVVDCGKSKIKQFRSRLGLDSLLVKPISKSAAVQRRGRAGREAPGQCYRLYTEADYLSLQQSNTPEILRCDLAQAILNMKARGVGDITSFPFLDRPPRESLEKALMQLFQLRALDDTGSVTSVGLEIAKLPLSAPLGKVLLTAAESEAGCLLEAIDIISCFSVENIFLNLASEEAKEQAETARRAVYRREGDHLTLLQTVQAYAAENADRKSWAEKHFVSHRAMQAAMVVSLPARLNPVITDANAGSRTCGNSFGLNADSSNSFPPWTIGRTLP